MKLPVGYRFKPLPEELIKEYLLKKVMGEVLPWDGIKTVDLYGDKAPWEICSQAYNEEDLYFFTNLKKLSKNRVARFAGCGEWHEKTSGKKIIDSRTKKVIGLKKKLIFGARKRDKLAAASVEKNGGNWIMYEYSLAGSSLMKENKDGYVLCQIVKPKNHDKDDDDDDQKEDGQEIITSMMGFCTIGQP